jgi:hypothetical protein
VTLTVKSRRLPEEIVEAGAGGVAAELLSHPASFCESINPKESCDQGVF